MKTLTALLLVFNTLFHIFFLFNNAKTHLFSDSLKYTWILAFLLFILAIILYLTNTNLWWLPCLIAILISQTLVFFMWQTLRLTTIPNFIVLIIVILSFSNWNFETKVKSEINGILTNLNLEKKQIITKKQLNNLPSPVSLWLENSGILDKPKIVSVRLKQKCQIKLNQKQGDWIPAKAIQYFNIEDPAFIWKVNMKINPILKVSGRDKLENGKGNMLIKLFSLIPIVNERGPKINEGSLQRFLGEIAWFPSAALNPYIKWYQIDKHSAKAVINYDGSECSGIFTFNEKGKITQFKTWRYMGNDNDQRHEWIITVDSYKPFNGITIPNKLRANCKLENKKWTWIKIDIENIQYNTNKIFL